MGILSAIMENQVEKTKEHERESGIIERPRGIGVSGFPELRASFAIPHNKD